VVKIIPEEERRFYYDEELEGLFPDKWLLLTNTEFTEYMEFVKGILVAIADNTYEDQEKGIYEEFYNDDNYGETFSCDLRNYSGFSREDLEYMKSFEKDDYL